MKRVALALAPLAAFTAAAASTPTYTLTKSVPLGSPDRWDYVTYDGGTNRIFVAHGDRLAVIDAGTGNLVGEVEGIAGGTHGSVVSLPTGQGFTDDGRNGKAVAFDLRTLKITHEITADADADAIALDPVTGHVFIIEGDPAAVTVIDPKTDSPVATIKAGEKLEYAVGDGHGSIFVSGEGGKDVLKIDARTNSVVNRWPTPNCTSPHGIAVDPREHRIFMGCVNKLMMVVDTVTGRVVAELPIGQGNDAVAFDPVRRRVFSSNGRDGTITAYQQVSADHYVALPLIQTEVSARTMSVDPKTGRLFVAGANTDPSPTPNGRPQVRPGTLRLMIFAPQG
ncbi:MAG TPA: YncE family protein [Sphingomicrobium sp.]|nr:YncE family protein [Sphingomicrobium sp.]